MGNEEKDRINKIISITPKLNDELMNAYEIYADLHIASLGYRITQSAFQIMLIKKGLKDLKINNFQLSDEHKDL